jgi:hypothetical protein
MARSRTGADWIQSSLRSEDENESLLVIYIADSGVHAVSLAR